MVIKRKPLEKIEIDHPDYVEFYCTNDIKTKKRGIDAVWIERKCQNRLLVKKIKVK